MAACQEQDTLSSVWAANDPRWEGHCAPLREYLRTPRSWIELRWWRRDNHINGMMLRQMLAWLSLQGRAVFDFETERWRSIWL